MSHKSENVAFICENCGKEVVPVTNGSYRNHCPFCLCSKHVDVMPGDRASECKGIMDPIGVVYKPAKGWQLVHQCRKCGAKAKNIVAESTLQEDNRELIRKLSQRPMID